MVEIMKVTDNTIELSGVQFKDGNTVQAIMDICHKWKHMYCEGFPCGRKTRKEQGLRLKRWKESPNICFTYLVTNDTKSHNLLIRILVSDTASLLKRFTEEELKYHLHMFVQNVAEDILKL